MSAVTALLLAVLVLILLGRRRRKSGGGNLRAKQGPALALRPLPIIPNPAFPAGEVGNSISGPTPAEVLRRKQARDVWNLLPSDRTVPCPDCGERTTHPQPGCLCPPIDPAKGRYWGTKHINMHHHTCTPKPTCPVCEQARKDFTFIDHDCVRGS